MITQLMTARQTAELLATTPDTLKYWRLIGKGPTAYKVGARWKYDRQEVLQFVESCRYVSPVQLAVEKHLKRFSR